MRTKMTDLFGIDAPLMLAGMNWVTEPKLVSAVSIGGGLGVLGATRFTKEEAQRNIKEIKNLTDKPFGVNISLLVPHAGDILGVAIKERVPVVNYLHGKPWFINQVHEYGGKVVATVATAKNALRAEQMGVDAIIVSTYEAAAHGSETTAMILIPLIRRQVGIPLIAAAGIHSGRGLAAVLMLGADGVCIGQRFLTTQECQVAEKCKQLYIDATEQDLIRSDVFDGLRGTVLKTKASEALTKQSGFPLIRGAANAMHIKRTLKLSLWQVIRTLFKSGDSEDKASLLRLANQVANFPRLEKAFLESDLEEGIFFGGQAVAGINDLPTCREVIDRIVAEACDTLAEGQRCV